MPPRVPVPLRERRGDLAFLAFYALNATVITYVVDLEQLVIADPGHFTTRCGRRRRWSTSSTGTAHLRPAADGPAAVLADDDLDRRALLRPFYFAALYAFVRGRDWIRVPALVWSGTMLANVLIILMEERFGASRPRTSGWCSPPTRRGC